MGLILRPSTRRRTADGLPRCSHRTSPTNTRVLPFFTVPENSTVPVDPSLRTSSQLSPSGALMLSSPLTTGVVVCWGLAELLADGDGEGVVVPRAPGLVGGCVTP